MPSRQVNAYSRNTGFGSTGRRCGPRKWPRSRITLNSARERRLGPARDCAHRELDCAWLASSRRIARRNRGIAIAVDESRQILGEPGIQRPVSGKVSLVQQADVQLHVLVMNFYALARGPHRMAHPQSGIPKALEKG